MKGLTNGRMEKRKDAVNKGRGERWRMNERRIKKCKIFVLLSVQVSKTDPSPKREMPTMILFNVVFALRV